MGRDLSEITSSIVSLRNIEIDRSIVAPKKKGNAKIKSLFIPNSYNEVNEDILDANLNHLGGDFNEGALHEGLDHLCCDLNVTPRKKKSKTGKKNKVVRPPKKPNTPSKLCLR